MKNRKKNYSHCELTVYIT